MYYIEHMFHAAICWTRIPLEYQDPSEATAAASDLQRSGPDWAQASIRIVSGATATYLGALVTDASIRHLLNEYGTDDPFIHRKCTRALGGCDTARTSCAVMILAKRYGVTKLGTGVP